MISLAQLHSPSLVSSRSPVSPRVTLFALILVIALSLCGVTTTFAQATNNPPVVDPGRTTTLETQQLKALLNDFCDDHGLNPGSQQVLWNGNDVTSSFPYQAGTGQAPYCTYHGTSSGSISAQAGLNTLSVKMCESLYTGGPSVPLCSTTTKQIRYRDVDVTPASQVLDKAPNRAGQYVDFLVAQLGTTGNPGNTNFAVTVTCSGYISNCTPSSSSLTFSGSLQTPQPLRVTFTTGAQDSIGSIQVVVAATNNAEDRSIAGASISNRYPQVLTVGTAQNNNDNQVTAACALDCFAATAAVSTIPYYSMDAPRSVTLAYNGDRVGARAFVYTDVSLGAAADPVSSFTIDVRGASTNARIPFVNGDSVLTFGPGASATQAVRLAGQLDMSSQRVSANAAPGVTGVYPVSVLVTANFRDAVDTSKHYSQSQTITMKLMVVNEQNSAVARGWTVAGVARLYEQSTTDSSALITEGDGSAIYFLKSGSSYVAPLGEFRRLTVSGTDTSRQWLLASVDSTKEIFNYLGLLKKVTDRFGNSVDFDYDISKNPVQLVKIYDPIRTIGSNKVYTELTYGAYGVVKIEDLRTGGASNGGRVTNIVADASGIRSVQDAGGTESFGYDANGRLSMITDPSGNSSTFLYASGPSWKITGLRSPAVPIDIGAGAVRDSMLVTGLQPWQTAGVPFAHIDPNAPPVPVNVSAVAAVVTDPGGHQTRMTVDRWGQPLTVTDPLGNVTTTTRNSNGQALRFTGPDGSVTAYNYTGPFIIQSTQEGLSTTSFTYGAWGQLTLQSGTGPTVEYFTNSTASGRLDSTKVGGQFKTRYTYDSRGRLLTVVDPKLHTTSFSYDPFWGNRDSVATSTGLGSKTKFDRFGRDSLSSSVGHGTTTRTYDDANRLIRHYDGVNSSPATVTYDLDRPARVVDPKGQLFKTEYNALGWPKRLYDAKDTTRFVSMTYNPDGQVTSRTNREGRRIDMSYDALHRRTSRSDALADSVSIAYDALGLRAVAKSFDRNRALVAMDSNFTALSGWTDSVVTWLNGQRFRRYYRMDLVGRLDSLNTVSSTNIDFYARRWFYGQSTGLLDSLRVGTRRVRYHHDTDGLPDTTDWAVGGVSRQQSWTGDHQPDVTSFSTTGFNNAFHRDLDYDNQGRVNADTRWGSNVNGSTTHHRNYGYDGLGELQRAYRDSLATVKQCVTTQTPPYLTCTSSLQTFVTRRLGLYYDPAENLQRQVDSISAVSSTDSVAPGNRLGLHFGVSYAYDRDGNLISRASTGTSAQFGWDASGQLRWAASGTDTTYFDYDAAGQLVRRRKSGGLIDRWFLWDQGQIFAELNAAATDRKTEYAYAGGVDQPAARITGATGASTLEWYQQGTTGNVDGLLDATGATVNQTLSYDEWGALEGSSGSNLSTLRWKGMYYDAAPADLYFARARWYDPQARRFISEDPIGLGGGINQFVFGGNDPINKIDPSGTNTALYCAVIMDPGCLLAAGLSNNILLDLMERWRSFRIEQEGMLQGNRPYHSFQETPYTPSREMMYFQALDDMLEIGGRCRDLARKGALNFPDVVFAAKDRVTYNWPASTTVLGRAFPSTGKVILYPATFVNITKLTNTVAHEWDHIARPFTTAPELDVKGGPSDIVGQHCSSGSF
jgi:RHS repeat-associated protein